MKKWLIGILLIVVIAIASVYIWIPARIMVHSSTGIGFKRAGFERIMMDEKNWIRWWPKENPGQQELLYKGRTYVIQEKKLTSFEIVITDPKKQIGSSLNIFYANKDSAILEWSGVVETSLNPIKRIQQFRESKKLKQDLQDLLTRTRDFFSDTRNIYGTLIREALVEDSVLAFTEETTNAYPSTEFIYSMINRLKNELKQKGVKEAGFPMLNISGPDNRSWLVKIAIPVDRELPAFQQISFKRMLKRGNILVTEVRGGPWQQEQAFNQVEIYMRDHERLAPAIPYYSLVTDRMSEPDSSKWVTRIYYPVM